MPTPLQLPPQFLGTVKAGVLAFDASSGAAMVAAGWVKMRAAVGNRI
jgi:hypothetical protein